MKKKILSIILSIVMVLGILPISAFASELSETLTCTQSSYGDGSVTGTHFQLTTHYFDTDGTILEQNEKIESLNGEIITKIEGHCSYNSSYMVDLNPSSGSWKNVGNAKFEITGINSTFVTFNPTITSRQYAPQYNTITIYYTEAPSHTHEADTTYMSNATAHWYACKADGCDLKTVEDYEKAFADSTTGAALKTTLGYAAHVFTDGKCVCGASNNKTEITAEITAADFGYTMVIPTSTALTEAAHTDVLLGTDGIVSIKDIKHPTDKVNVYYTVDLTNGDLTDGTTTITATYKYKQGEGEFAAINGTTKVTVYENATVKDSLVNVTADDTTWKAAPAGTYNATVVFNFEKEEAAPATIETVGDVLNLYPGDFPTTKETAVHFDGIDWNDGGNFYVSDGALYEGDWSVVKLSGSVEEKEYGYGYFDDLQAIGVYFYVTDGVLTVINVSIG